VRALDVNAIPLAVDAVRVPARLVRSGDKTQCAALHLAIGLRFSRDTQE
jgi:hypothetical protein